MIGPTENHRERWSENVIESKAIDEIKNMMRL